MKTIEEAAILYAKSGLYKINSVGDKGKSISSFKAGVEFAERWIPVEKELPEDECKINEIDSSNILVKFEDGNIMRYDEDNWPMLQVTHWRPINHK